MTTNEIIQSYYNSLNNKDSVWQEMWVDDAFFADASQVLVAKGKDEVIKSFTIFLKGMKSVTVKQMIVEGEKVCAVASYVYQNQKGQEMKQDVAEVWEIRGNKLSKLIIYFDLTSYRDFMKS